VNIKDFKNTMKLMLADESVNKVEGDKCDIALTWNYQIDKYSKLLQSRYEKKQAHTSLSVVNHRDTFQELNLQQLASYLGHVGEQNSDLGEMQEAISNNLERTPIITPERHRYAVMDWVGRFFSVLAKEDDGEFLDSLNEMLLNYDSEVPKLYKVFRYTDGIWGRFAAVQKILFSKDFIDRYYAWSKKKRSQQIALRKAYSVILSREAVLCFASAKRDKFIIAGFSYQEPWGCWSNARKSMLSLNLKGEDDVFLSFKVQPFTASERKPLIVHLSVNKHKIATWKFDSNVMQTAEVGATVPRKLISSDGEVVLEFSYSGTVSPKQLGINEDARELALGFIEIRRK